VTGLNFTAAANATYSISGSVTSTGSGATVTLSGAASATVTADGSGNYTFTGLANGSYTVTPSKSGYSFTPPNRGVTVSGANVTGQDFTATGGGYDYAFLDDQGRSKLCVNSATGAYTWSILTGTGAGSSFSGTAKVTSTAAMLSLSTVPGDTKYITLSYNKTSKTASGTFRTGTTVSSLYDANAANDPPGLCP